MARNPTVAKTKVLVMVGTRKGGFILSSDESRKRWAVSGPHAQGGEVFHMAYDHRNGSMFAAVNYFIWGPQLQISHDLGQTWSDPVKQPRFTGQGGQTVKRIWHVEPGRDIEPNVLYAGVEPAALFKSADGGETWREVEGLSQHPTREKWQPGNGGLCLHSMVLDPLHGKRMWVGISAVGVFGTLDKGANWQPMNKNVRADFQPDRFPEFGQCVHKLLSPAARPNVLYQQNHCGVYRSDNGGDDWQDISEGLPSRFGFVLGLHSHDPDTLYVLPEDKALNGEVGGMNRFVTDAKFRVFRSRNGGADWEPLTRGLPQKNAYLHAMREGMATDSLDPCGIYVGTTAGKVFYSRDDGDTWELLAEDLPPINSVSCGVVG
jgi:hypothetical protein